MPEQCLDSEDVYAQACASNAATVRVTQPTLITGAPGVHLDFAEIRRFVSLEASVTLENITIYGLVTDAAPYVGFFLFTGNASLYCNGCTIMSPCGGQNAIYMMNLFQETDPNAKFTIAPATSANASGSTGMVATNLYGSSALSVDVVRGSTGRQVLRNASLVCDPALMQAPTFDTHVDPGQTCQNASDLGVSYRGATNKTKSGATCQAWASLTPNFHTWLPSAHPLAGLVDNYCRNPDNSAGGPWCYTIDGPRQEDCSIPECVVNPANTTDGSKPCWGVDGWRLWVVLTFAGLALGVIIGGGVLCVQRRPSSNMGSVQLIASDPLATGDDAKPGKTHGSGNQEPAVELRAAIEAMGMDDKQLLIQDVVGKGGFGVVYRGIWRGLEVAIKTVTFPSRNGGNAQQRAIAEAAITFSLSHPNVVATYHHDIKPLKLVAQPGSLSVQGDDSVSDWKLYLVQEYCPAGSLRKAVDSGRFLARSGRPKLIQCVECLLDVAHGVKYIHSKSIIHGDLNPSNVLLKQRVEVPPSSASDTRGSQRSTAPSGAPPRSDVRDSAYGQLPLNTSSGVASSHPCSSNSVSVDMNDSTPTLERDSSHATWDLTAKVCDFGLSMKLDPMQTHFSNMRQGTAFYIAPEVHAAGQLSMAADVHAFGVMMWECYHSRAPYKMTRSRKLVRRREFPKYPKDCPLSYAVLSIACLSREPENRPNFWQIVGVLEDLAVYLRDFEPGQATSCAHVTLEQLEKMDMGQQSTSRANDSWTSELPLTQQAMAAMQSIIVNVSEPDIEGMDKASCRPNEASHLEAPAPVSIIHSLADEAGVGIDVSKVYYGGATGASGLWPIEDGDADSPCANSTPAASAFPDTNASVSVVVHSDLATRSAAAAPSELPRVMYDNKLLDADAPSSCPSGSPAVRSLSNNTQQHAPPPARATGHSGKFLGSPVSEEFQEPTSTFLDGADDLV